MFNTVFISGCIILSESIFDRFLKYESGMVKSTLTNELYNVRSFVNVYQ